MAILNPHQQMLLMACYEKLDGHYEHDIDYFEQGHRLGWTDAEIHHVAIGLAENGFFRPLTYGKTAHLTGQATLYCREQATLQRLSADRLESKLERLLRA